MLTLADTRVGLAWLGAMATPQLAAGDAMMFLIFDIHPFPKFENLRLIRLLIKVYDVQRKIT
ncbi:MAG: hypothetical protein IIC24_06205 [Chloroflexi bacterium]|nr:hypothetical protein [Chloroflexota bacterium]